MSSIKQIGYLCTKFVSEDDNINYATPDPAKGYKDLSLLSWLGLVQLLIRFPFTWKMFLYFNAACPFSDQACWYLEVVSD